MAARILKGPAFKTPNFSADLHLSAGEYLWKILQRSENRQCLVSVFHKKISALLFYERLRSYNPPMDGLINIPFIQFKSYEAQISEII